MLACPRVLRSGIHSGYTLGHHGYCIVTPKLDHVVIDTRNRIDEAVRTYLSLGFQLTDRGRHTLGSVNHLAIFETDYMEFLGFDDNAGAVRADILRFPVGLNGLVFATDKPEVLFGDLRERGLAVEQPIAFSRPVALADRIEDAKFRVVRLDAGAVSFGRVYFCQHLTPKLVWRPEWGRHPNGALALAQVTIAAQDPASAGRTDYMAGLRIRTASLSQTARVLQVAQIPGVKIESQRIIVPASKAMNVVLEFVE